MSGLVNNVGLCRSLACNNPAFRISTASYVCVCVCVFCGLDLAHSAAPDENRSTAFPQRYCTEILYSRWISIRYSLLLVCLLLALRPRRAHTVVLYTSPAPSLVAVGRDCCCVQRGFLLFFLCVCFDGLDGGQPISSVPAPHGPYCLRSVVQYS